MSEHLIAVANRKYIERIQMVIDQLHDCDSRHVESVPVHEVFKGKTVWDGIVEVFDLVGHPNAKRCYAWTYGDPEEFITILEIPPVVDAQTAVKVGVSYQIKKSMLKKPLILRQGEDQ